LLSHQLQLCENQEFAFPEDKQAEASLLSYYSVFASPPSEWRSLGVEVVQDQVDVDSAGYFSYHRILFSPF
jgi:hypothetical protein